MILFGSFKSGTGDYRDRHLRPGVRLGLLADHAAPRLLRRSEIAAKEPLGMSLRELFIILLLVVLLVLLGFYPQPILDTSHSRDG